jgi:hypothetical protein
VSPVMPPPTTATSQRRAPSREGRAAAGAGSSHSERGSVHEFGVDSDISHLKVRLERVLESPSPCRGPRPGTRSTFDHGLSRVIVVPLLAAMKSLPGGVADETGAR